MRKEKRAFERFTNKNREILKCTKMTSFKQKSKQTNSCSQLNLLTAICRSQAGIQIDFAVSEMRLTNQEAVFYEIFQIKRKIPKMLISDWSISFQK